MRQLYDKYLHPDILPIYDDKLWEAACSGKILKLFQFDSQVGGQTIKKLQPRTPNEMALCNGVMRLMATEKGGEMPTDRYARIKANPLQWEAEMDSYGLTPKEKGTIHEYILNGVLVDQEALMRILMDERVCGFTLGESNNARKVVAKKQMKNVEQLHQQIIEKATSKAMGEYVWYMLAPSMGYSFSKIHGLAYSFIGLQTVYLATYFNPVYWNTACLRVDAGLDEDASTNYDKIAKAVGNIIHRGIPLSLIDINKSGYMFEPDLENGTILYGMKALNGVGGEIVQEIIEHRPYNSLADFMEKVKCNKTVMFSLIKSGAFDQFSERLDIMKEYVWMVCEPKKRITMQNFNGLMQRGMLPEELEFQKRLFVFNKALKKFCKVSNGYLKIENNFYDFYEEFFDIDELESTEEGLCIKETKWKKMYDKGMAPAKTWITSRKEELLNKLNDNLFDEVWDKYAAGSYSKWEMDSLGFYYHQHELISTNLYDFSVKEYNNWPSVPEVDYTFKRNGRNIPIYKTGRIAGTVIAKDDIRSCISILTINSGVVTVKFTKDYYAKYNRRISEVQADGTKKVREKGWFSRGTLVIINGFRRGDMFVAKRYKKTASHQLYKLTLEDDGTITATNRRWGEEEE